MKITAEELIEILKTVPPTTKISSHGSDEHDGWWGDDIVYEYFPEEKDFMIRAK